MSASCAALPTELGAVSALIEGVDCRTQSYVEAAYAQLFGPVGWLQPTLSAALTIYVALYGFQLLSGQTAMSASTVTKRMIGVGVVIALASNWPAYQTLVVGALSRGGSDLSSMLLRATASGAPGAGDLGSRLDALFATLADLASNWGRLAPLQPTADGLGAPAAISPPQPAPNVAVGTAVNMLWLSAIILALGAAGVAIVSKVILAFLLALGPVFFLLALFPSARGFFEGWLRTATANALLPLMATLSAAGMLPIVEPLVENVRAAQARGDLSAQPVFALTLAALMYGALMLQIVAAATRLAGAWRLPRGESATSSAAAAPAAASPRAAGVDQRITDIAAAFVGQPGAASTSAPSRSSNILAQGAAPFAADEAGRRDAFAARRTGAAYRGFSQQRVSAQRGA